jgi:hypothetical protein
MAKKQFNKAMLVVIASMLQSLVDGKTDEQILEEQKIDKISDKECTSELLIELLTEAKIQFDNAGAGTGNGLFFGNKDVDKEYPFSEKWKNHIVIRESIETKVGPKEGDVVEIPSSIAIKPFDVSLFQTHIKQDMFRGKKVFILHEPK